MGALLSCPCIHRRIVRGKSIQEAVVGRSKMKSNLEEDKKLVLMLLNESYNAQNRGDLRQATILKKSSISLSFYIAAYEKQLNRLQE